MKIFKFTMFDGREFISPPVPNIDYAIEWLADLIHVDDKFSYKLYRQHVVPFDLTTGICET